MRDSSNSAGPSRPTRGVTHKRMYRDNSDEDVDDVLLFSPPKPPRQSSQVRVMPSSDPLAMNYSESPQPPSERSSADILAEAERRNALERLMREQRDASASATASASASNSRPLSVSRQVQRRSEPVVEIPLLPLEEVRSYYHKSGTSSIPTVESRSRLPVVSSSDSLAASAHTSRSASRLTSEAPRAARNNPGWGVESSPSVQAIDEDEDMFDAGLYTSEAEGSDGGSLSDDDSDTVALRKGGRRRRNNARQREQEKEGKISSRTRAKRDDYPRSSSPISVSSDSDGYSRNRPRKRKTQSTKMPRGHDRSTIQRLQPEDGFSSFTPFSGSDDQDDAYEEVDELEEDDEESDFDPRHPGRRRNGGQRKGKKSAPVEIDEDVLFAHRPFCEKCSREPADDMLERARAKKLRSKASKKRKKNADMISDDELAGSLEGWLECLHCTVSSHWGCLGPQQKKDVLHSLLDQEGPPQDGEKPRRSVAIDESFKFTCAKCTANPNCSVCHKDHDHRKKQEAQDDMEKIPDEEAGDVKIIENEPEENGDGRPPMFRCLRCKQCAHYEHLEVPASLGESAPLKDVAYHYQTETEDGHAWFCHQCREWIWVVDIIIAWRPLPLDAKEPKLDPDEKANWKEALPREYLVKWTGRGFRHVTWVPHAWLQIKSAMKLRNFLEKGPSLDLVTDETLAAKGDDMAQPTIAALTAEDDQVTSTRKSHGQPEDGKTSWVGIGPGPERDAETSLPIEWSTVDRVLDVMLLPPSSEGKGKKKLAHRRGQRIMSASNSTSGSDRVTPAPQIDGEPSGQSPVDIMRERLGLKDGLQPSKEMLLDIDSYEEQTGREFDERDLDEVAGLVTWCFVKWDDLQYDQSTWDTPPPVTSPLYPAFKRSLARYLQARRVDIPVLTSAQCKQRDSDAEKAYVPPKEQPSCVVGGKLMPFQMEGFQWLLYKHFRRESCILADDMGLGKTIQIAAVLGYLGSAKYNIYPCLVVVPNSTITNWVREFEKWVPHLQVVPYYGEAASRKIISKYELYHKGMQGKAAGLRAHIVVTTYDMITGSEFRVFSGIPRWEVLCIDEGQRLKSDTNLIFNRLKTLNSVHRILMTGTPLNNNLRELFNLLNFLDPVTFRQLEDLESKFQNLNESLIQELHEMIKPYILRRIKADVLKLPPKIEIIVPISLTPLQKQVYKGVFERNADLIQAILQARRKKLRAGGG